MNSYSGQIGTILNLLLILTFIISGCAPTKQNLTNIIPSATSTLHIETSTPPPTSRTTSTPTVQPKIEIVLEGECMTLEENIPSDLHLSGVWIRNRGDPYLENLEDHTKYGISLEGGGLLDDMVISPDSKLLAYLDRYVSSD